MQEGEEPVARIVAIQGAPNRIVQHAMWRFTRRWADRGARIAGVIEAFDPTIGRSRHAAHLENVRTGEVYPLFQELGPMASACHLDGAGIVAACASVCGEIERGCDLVAPSKFGQLEARRTGLTDAFVKAVERDIPILTAVSPVYTDAWDAFSTPLGVILPAVDAELDNWWQAIGDVQSARGAKNRM